MSHTVNDDAASASTTSPVPRDSGEGGSATHPGVVLRRMWGNRAIQTVLAVYGILILLLLLSRFINPSYGSIGFVRTVVGLSTFTAVVAFGQGIVILTGGFDLSIPSTMTLSAVLLTGIATGSSAKTLWVIPLMLAVGAAIGAFNGIGVALLRLSPIVMTLATNTILGGVILLYTNGTPAGFTPPVIIHLVQGRLFGGALPEIIVVLIGFTVLGVLLLNYTSFGRRVYAVGSNPIVARLSGVRTGSVLVGVYVISGVCSAIGGMLLSGYSNQSYLGLGDPYLLLSLAAVVVGGSSIRGGRGYYLGTLAGAVILTAVSTMLAGTNLSQGFKQIVYAVVIIVAVLAVRQRE